MPNDDIVWDSAPDKAGRGRLLNAVRMVESGGNPNAVSPAGAIGPYQFMPATAKAMGVANPRDEGQARAGADRYLTQLEDRYGDTNLALLAYNWGPGNVDAWLKTGKGAKGQSMPTEAQQYVGKVRGKLAPADTNEGIVWDAPTEQPPKKEGLSEKARQYSLSEKPGTVEQFLGGAKHALDEAAASLQSLAGKAGLPTGESLQPLVEQGKEFVKETGPASTAGNIAGEIAMTAAPGAAMFKGVTAAPYIAKMGNLAKSFIGGAASGAAAEGFMGRNMGEGATLGAMLGPVGYGLAKGGNALIKEGQRFYEGASGRATEAAQKWLGDRTQTAINALRNTKPIVPGEVPTAGMAATSELPELAVLEGKARSGPFARLFQQADAQNAAAREQVLNDIIAGGERLPHPTTGKPQPSLFEEARNAQTDPLYAASMRELLPVPPAAERMLSAPEVRPMVRRAFDKFQQKVATARASGGQIPQRSDFTPGNTRFSGEQLDMIAKELAAGDMSNYNVREARRVVMDLLGQSQNYSDARQLFSVMSAPQNRADVAGVLRNKLVSPIDPGQQRATMFANALREAPQTIRKADLSPRFQTMEEVFAGNKGQLQNIRDLEQSLARQQTVENMPKSRGIVPGYQTEFEKAAQDFPTVMMRLVTMMKTGLKALGRRTDKQVQDIIDQAMVDPNKMADLLAALPPTERSQFINTMRKVAPKLQYGIGSTVAATQGTEE